MVVGVLYWAAWRIILPKIFGYEFVPRKETLDDGTVVTVVSICVFYSVFAGFAHRSYFQVFEQKDTEIRGLIGSADKLVFGLI